jgi:ankyrin repeat protein
MKHLLLTTIAAVVLVGCGPSEADRALVKAAGDGNIVAVKYHSAAGVDVNAPDVIKRTPLDHAASEGHKEIVELLIDKGADVNAMNNDGDTPLDFAIKFKNTETTELLHKHGAKTVEELKAEGK